MTLTKERYQKKAVQSTRLVSNTTAWIAVVAIAVGLSVSGCATITGTQSPITSSDLGQSVCPSDESIQMFEQKDEAERGTYRDDILSDCISAINRNYQSFKANLQRQTVETNLAFDLAAQGVSAASAVANGNAARELGAAGTGLIGAAAAINKDVLYQQTLPAIEAAMDSNRNKILTRIVQLQSGDPDAKSYTLTSARSDIASYEAAGNIYVAIGELTSTANAAAEQSKDDLQNAKAEYTAELLEPTVYAREKALRDKIASLTDAKKLKGIIDALGLTPTADPKAERKAIIGEIDKRVTEVGADHKKVMDKVEALLNPILKGK